ncbi:MAG: competence/damage-inducible protein A [Thermostichales cyanobacterium SZTDM-1c_bins_54]
MTPKAEILCIGTELLLGEITNTNAQYLAQQLARLGIPHHVQTVVGDNIGRIHHVLDGIVPRCQLLLITGGLGPTPDDLTHAALAEYFHVPLVEYPGLWQEIVRKYQQRGLTPSPSNRKQALLPQGSQVLANPSGSAAGIIWSPRPDLTLMTFPGVPGEMERMWQEGAVPYIQQQGWVETVLVSRVLRHWGIPESVLAERLGSLLDNENPTVAPYAGQGEVRIRVTARAPNPAAAEALLAPIVAQVQALGGEDYFGSDDQSLAGVVGSLLRQRQQTLAVAESCSGGGLGHLITGIPGSSGYFLGGVIAYDNRIKTALLGVSPELLAREGAVSEATAIAMAQGVQQRLGSHWALSITGIAGPGGGSPEKPVGLVWIGIAAPTGQAWALEQRFNPQRGRESIRHFSAQTALDVLRRTLQRL